MFYKLVLAEVEKAKNERKIIMSKKSRTEKGKVLADADWGVWALAIIVTVMGILAYNYECIGDKWTKVLEIVGAPFALGLGFFAFDKSFEVLDKYNERKNKEEDQ